MNKKFNVHINCMGKTFDFEIKAGSLYEAKIVARSEINKKFPRIMEHTIEVTEINNEKRKVENNA